MKTIFEIKVNILLIFFLIQEIVQLLAKTVHSKTWENVFREKKNIVIQKIDS